MRNKIVLAVLMFLYAFTGTSQVKIICIGNSVTHGTADTAYLNRFSYPVLKSWRYPFWVLLDSLNTLSFDMVGSQKKLYKQGDSAAPYPKSPYTGHVFDSAHEARWGASSDSVVKALKKEMKDTADIAFIHIGGSDNDTVDETTVSNIDTIITLLRNKNPYITIFLAQVIAGGAINDSILNLATQRNTLASPVKAVDLASGWDKGTMSLDSVIPDSTGEKYIARRFFNALMTCDVATTTTAPANVKQTGKTSSSISISWKKGLNSPDVFSGYNVYVNNVRMNAYLIKDTFFTIQGLKVLSSYNIRVTTVDYRTKTEKTSSTQAFLTSGYTVRFKVLYNEKPVEGAKVTFNSINQYTDTAGNAVFNDVAAGPKTYNVQKTGFFEIISTYQNIQSDTLFVVQLKSIDLHDESDEIAVYPVPASSFLVVSGTRGSILELYTSTGELLMKMHCTDETTVLEISHLPEGIYFIKSRTGTGEIVRKIILTK